MVWGDDARRFMARVVPWPGEGPGYVNAHWQVRRSDNGGSFFLGSPHRTVEEFVSKARWLVANGTGDIFFCLSLQANTKINARGKEVAHREQAKALSLRSFWLDLDIKEKGYGSLEEAVVAANALCEKAKIPRYNCAVGSGGGLHIYWILDAPIAPAEWQPIANGLKREVLKANMHCDVGCTVDSARILRVPETFNNKLDTPRLVRLLKLDATDLPLDAFKHLAAPEGAGLGIDNGLGPNFPPQAEAPFKMEVGDEGISTWPTPDWTAVARECPLIREALVTGGKDFGQPMWMLTTLAATFLGEKGNMLAHEMAKGHKEYDPASTEGMWQRKLKEREKNPKLGWPSCATMQANGSKHCGTCQHLTAGKSPLNLGLSGSMHPSVAVAAYHALHLPVGFAINQDGQICIITTKGKKGDHSKDDDEDQPLWVPLFLNKHFSGPWVEESDDDVLHFTVAVGQKQRKLSIAQSMMINGEFWKEKKLGLRPTDMGLAKGRTFLMAWLNRLSEVKGSVEHRGFGWIEHKHFVFAGHIYKPNGETSEAAFRDGEMRRQYTPIGTIDPWYKAAKFITDMNSPGHEVVLATAFAAPLMPFTGQKGVLLSVHGGGGEGKTTTKEISLAVWGHPEKASDRLASTANFVSAKLGKLNNLPIYWDEIRDESHQRNLSTVLTQLTEGGEKGRMKDGERMQAGTDWHTMLSSYSNRSFIDFITREQKHTTAWMYRVIEYQLDRPNPAAVAKYNSFDMHNEIVGPLSTNHGRMGEKYSSHLADSAKGLKARVRKVGTEFIKQAGISGTRERFWSAFAASILVGMELANELGCEFHIEAARKFLIGVVEDMRRRVIVESFETDEGVENILTDFLKDARRNTIGTDRCLTLGDNQKSISVKCYNPEPPIRQSDGKKIVAQYVDTPGLLRISLSALRKWLSDNKHNPTMFMGGLKRLYGATASVVTLGSGTGYQIGKERVIDLTIVDGGTLDDNRKAISSDCSFYEASAPKAA